MERHLIFAFLVRSNILGGFAGVTSDANTLVNYARNTCQNVLLRYDDDIPVEHLTQYMCDLKQGYTQYGGESGDTEADGICFALTFRFPA